MQTIEYKAIFQPGDGTTEVIFVSVTGQTERSCATKALAKALRNAKPGWQFCSIEFWAAR